MVKAKAELSYLPQNQNLIQQSPEFSAMQAELKKIPRPPEEIMQQGPAYPVVENCPTSPQNSSDEICDLPMPANRSEAGH